MKINFLKFIFYLILSFCGFSNCFAQESIADDTTIYQIPDKLAEFPGGVAALNHFIRSNLKYPESGGSGHSQAKSIVEFVVNTDGKISGIKTETRPRPFNFPFYVDCGVEACRVVSIMPPWIPARKNKKQVRSVYFLPFFFTQESTATVDSIQLKILESNPQSRENNKPVSIHVLAPARFHGGNGAVNKFIKRNLKYPANAKKKGIHGRVMVMFTVSNDGSLSEIKVIKGIDPECDEEAKRVISLLPAWIPARSNGETVPYPCVVTIVF